MKEIFKKALELEGMITDMTGKCDILSIEVNATMLAYNNSDRKPDKFLANRYLELVDDLVRYGLIEKKW